MKKKGDDHYLKEKFEQAAEFYTRAINVSPTEEPVYYSNRSACELGVCADSHVLIRKKGYVNMKPPKLDLTIEDSGKAIALNKDHVKVINRRANALEALDRLEEALRGRFTTFVVQPCLTSSQIPRLHHCHDFRWIPERKVRSGGGARVKKVVFHESRRNNKGSNLLFLVFDSH